MDDASQKDYGKHGSLKGRRNSVDILLGKSADMTDAKEDNKPPKAKKKKNLKGLINTFSTD